MFPGRRPDSDFELETKVREGDDWTNERDEGPVRLLLS